jgi:hypothetical protein
VCRPKAFAEVWRYSTTIPALPPSVSAAPVYEQIGPPMKDQDTVTIVIASLLVLPWLARVLMSAKTIWRALMDGQKMKGRKNGALT